jgi:hypothetical protein
MKNKVMIGAVMSVIILSIAGLFWMNQQKDNNKEVASAESKFGEVVTESRSYIGEVVSGPYITPTVTQDQIIISFDEVESSGIVNFDIENNEGTLVPMMAYITPSGRLFAGSSMCEPCRGRTFSLAGETLVCDTCRTTYDIETHEFIKGAIVCGQYPPEFMEPIVDDGQIIIDLNKVLVWRTRI